MSELVKEYTQWYDRWESSGIIKETLGSSKHLHDLCDEWLPGHSDKLAVLTKVRMLGRFFITHMERHLIKVDEEFIDGPHRLAECLHANAAEVDRRIDEIRALDNPWAPEAEAKIVEIVEWMNDLITPVRSKNMLVFCSKYLFSHTAGKVYIQDSWAFSAARKFRRKPRKKPGEPDPSSEYADYGSRLTSIGRELTAAVPDKNPNVRNVDLFLYFRGRTTEEQKATKTTGSKAEDTNK